MLHLLIAPICFVLDQFCKSKAEANFDSKTKEPILGDTIILKLSYNEGAFLGLLKNNKKLLLALNIICVSGLIIFNLLNGVVKGKSLYKIGSALITGGAMSNIYDRLTRHKVVDYFSFKFKPNIVFNLADMFIFIGCFLVFIRSLFSSK